jgi:FAD/FMN-containing dehydrogenase
MLNPVDDAVLDSLRAALPAGVLRAPEPRDLEEPRGKWHGQAGIVVSPQTTEQVATVIRLAGQARVGVVPISGGTGLVAGQVATDGPAPILLSLDRMRAIRGVWPTENVMVAEAGAILAEVQAAADAAHRLFPLSLASEGTCRIGGNLSTNAGGVQVLHYGNARELCLGLEAVLPDGQIWHGLRRLRKDNTGYDLRNLLIGAEGTLGVITAASLRLFARPSQVATALLVVPDPQAALNLLALAGGHLGPSVTAFELLSGQGLQFLSEANLPHRPPFAETPDWSVLIDVSQFGAGDPNQALEALFADALEAGLTSDGIVAQSESQRTDLWRLRETIPAANRVIGAIASHDIALPLSEIPAFVDQMPALLAKLGDVRVNCFGHLGDGNLHYNVFPALGRSKAEYSGIAVEASGVIHQRVHALGGSFSAEHGVGRAKVADLERFGDPARLDAMRRIKRALDPLGIMNPGAVLATR